MKIRNLTLDNNVFLAPMAGVTDLPYRSIMKRFGSGLVFTEMISANGLFHGGNKTYELLHSLPEERPLAIQLFGGDAEVLARAAAKVAPSADLVDLNMGCPVKKVLRSGAGSALLREPRKVAGIVCNVRRAIDRPLTIKIRSGWDSSSLNFLEIGRIAQEEGADAIILHPRTRAQGFGGRADWSHIRQLKEGLRIPVVGSGDIFCAQDALDMKAQTGCDAVMVGRGSYGNPWLIESILRLQAKKSPTAPSPQNRHAVACEHLHLHLERFGPQRTLGEMRKHLCWYSKGLPGSASFRAALNNSPTIADLRSAVDEFFLASTG